jgi:hypothetical protein
MGLKQAMFVTFWRRRAPDRAIAALAVEQNAVVAIIG